MKTKGTKSRLHVFLWIGLGCLILAGFLTYRTYHQVRQMPFPVRRQVNVEEIQDWMTLTYVARTYGVPEPVLLEKLQIDPLTRHNWSLKRIAKQNSIDSVVLITKIRQIILDSQKDR